MTGHADAPALVGGDERQAAGHWPRAQRSPLYLTWGFKGGEWRLALLRRHRYGMWLIVLCAFGCPARYVEASRGLVWRWGMVLALVCSPVYLMPMLFSLIGAGVVRAELGDPPNVVLAPIALLYLTWFSVFPLYVVCLVGHVTGSLAAWFEDQDARGWARRRGRSR